MTKMGKPRMIYLPEKDRGMNGHIPYSVECRQWPAEWGDVWFRGPIRWQVMSICRAYNLLITYSRCDSVIWRAVDVTEVEDTVWLICMD